MPQRGAKRNRLDHKAAQLLIVDIQERLLPSIHEHERIVAQAARMIRAARELQLPVLVSEQYPRGLGRTAAPIAEAAADAPRLEKMTFSSCADPGMRQHLTAANRPQVLLVGIEAHVCVQQTALDLADSGFQPFVLADAISSRRELDWRIALDRMRQGGVLVTTVEAAIFELLHEAGTDVFKRILPLVR